MKHKPNRRIPLLWKCCIILGLPMVFFGLVPSVQGIVHLGSLSLLAGGGFFLAAGLWVRRQQTLLRPSRQQSIFQRRTAMLWLLLLATAAFLTAYTALWGYFAYLRPPQPQGEATVVVLGCKIRGEEPSLMLRRRLDRAVEYLRLNPAANCVVSGGVGKGERYSEAHVMERYLLSQGVQPHRIFQEPNSVNTRTNLQNSLQVVEQNHLSRNLVVSTDGFHQLRAYLYGRRCGVEARAISANTPVWVVPSYAIREFFGIVKLLLLEG